MWFKNLRLYRFSPAPKLTADQLDAQLHAHALQPCSASERQRLGWVPPAAGESLAYALNRQLLIALGSEQKLLPASVVNQVTKDRVLDIEEQQGFKPGRKQVRDIKQQVTDELLPKAFSIRKRTHVWIDPVLGWLVIDAASTGRCDEVIELLARSVDDLVPRPLRVNLSPRTAMTEWLAADEAPPGFTVDLDAELRSIGEGKATVRYVRHALDAEEIRRHIAGGKTCTRLALTWNDRISLVLTEDLAVKRLAYLDTLKDGADTSFESEEERFDADFALATGELSKLLLGLVEALGGEAEGPAGTTAELPKMAA